MIQILWEGQERELGGQSLILPLFKCFRITEGVRNMICMAYLLAKRPDYFMREGEGAHVSWLSVFFV